MDLKKKYLKYKKKYLLLKNQIGGNGKQLFEEFKLTLNDDELYEIVKYIYI